MTYLIKDPGRVVDDYLSFIDFAPTILEAAGISEEQSGMQPIQGRSLTGIFSSSKNGLVDKKRFSDRNVTMSVGRAMPVIRRNLAHDLWEINFGKRVEEELYNIMSDPECTINLAYENENDILKQKLKSQLVKELTEQNDQRILGNGDLFDNYVYAEERTRNFFERYMKGEVTKQAAGWVDSTDFEEK